jgi:hypothetical protein
MVNSICRTPRQDMHCRQPICRPLPKMPFGKAYYTVTTLVRFTKNVALPLPPEKNDTFTIYYSKNRSQKNRIFKYSNPRHFFNIYRRASIQTFLECLFRDLSGGLIFFHIWGILKTLSRTYTDVNGNWR